MELTPSARMIRDKFNSNRVRFSRGERGLYCEGLTPRLALELFRWYHSSMDLKKAVVFGNFGWRHPRQDYKRELENALLAVERLAKNEEWPPGYMLEVFDEIRAHRAQQPQFEHSQKIPSKRTRPRFM